MTDMTSATLSIPVITEDTAQVAAALRLAGAGVYVFPLDHPELPQCIGIGKSHDPFSPRHQRGKHPCVPWVEKATIKDKVIYSHWSGTPRNVGVHCGKSGLLVVDEDEEGALQRYANDHGFTIPETYRVRTADGQHYYFLDTQNGTLGNEEGAFGAYPINIRSGNGYVVGPASLHETGVIYTPINDAAVVPVPQWVVDAIKSKMNGHKVIDADGVVWETTDPFGPDGYQLPEVIKDHHRDTELFKFASSMRAQGINRPLAKVLMEVAWKRCEQPPDASHEFTWAEALGKLDNAYSAYAEGRSEGYEKRSERSPNAAAPARRVRLTPASTIKPRPVRWLWTDRVPAGELTLTPGRGGLGKSTFHAWIIAHLTRGTLPGVHFGTPKPCVIAASEDSWERTIVPRLIAAGADMDLVHRVDVVTETNDVVSVSFPTDIDGLTEEIISLGVALISVDPVMSVLSNSLDTHKDREVRGALEPLGRMADRTGCVVLGNAHFNKSTGNDPLSLIMGSAAFGNVARAALGFARDDEAEDGSCVISQVKNNLGRLDLPSLRYAIEEATLETDEGPASVGKLVMLGESDRSVSDILRDRDRDARKDGDEHNEIDQWLIEYLTESDGEAPAADVIAAAKKSGWTEGAVKKARMRIKAQSKRHGFGKESHVTWRLIGSIGSIDSQSQKPGTYGTYEESMGESAAPCLACRLPIGWPNPDCSQAQYHKSADEPTERLPYKDD